MTSVGISVISGLSMKSASIAMAPIIDPIIAPYKTTNFADFLAIYLAFFTLSSNLKNIEWLKSTQMEINNVGYE